MKNHDEFRRLVFEKAEKYEKQRKARNKKIVNSALICSLVLAICFPIGTYVYNLHDNAFSADETTAASVQTEAGTSTLLDTTTAATRATTTEATFTTTTVYTTTTYATTTETALTTTAAATTQEFTCNTETKIETTTTEETTAADGTAITPDLLASGTTFDITVFSHLVAYEKNTSYHRFPTVDQLSCFALGTHYGIDIKVLLAVCDEEFFKTKKLIAVETMNLYADEYEMSGTDCTLKFQMGNGNASHLYFFAIDKDSNFNVEILP